MLYYLSQFLQQQAAGTAWVDCLSPLRVFRYITFRSAGAAVTALLFSLWLGPKVIGWLKQLKFGQHYADKAEEGGGLAARVLSKKGTPTMGGILIVLVLDLAALLWAQWNALILLTLLSLIVLAGLGFYDDYMKITQQNNRGTASHVKLWVQCGLALFIGIYLWMLPGTKKLITDVMVPFFKHPVLTGAGLGFLWFNCHPEQVFMGDTGSLALGGVLGIIAVLIHQPLVLVIAGGVFVAEAASVMLQTSWFKYTRRRTGAGRRIFLMAPLHHHFEKKGWYESQVVIRFYILCFLCAVVALSTLKLR